MYNEWIVPMESMQEKKKVYTLYGKAVAWLAKSKSQPQSRSGSLPRSPLSPYIIIQKCTFFQPHANAATISIA